MEPLDILSKFLVSGRTDWKGRPFLHPGPWSAATNSHTLIAYKGKIVEPVKGSPDIPFLNKSYAEYHLKLNIKHIQEWAGPCGMPMTSDEKVERVHEGVIVGVNIDRRKLAYLLEHFPAEEVIVWDSTSMVTVKSIGIMGGKWRATLAGLESSAHDCYNLYSPAVDPFDLMLSLGDD